MAHALAFTIARLANAADVSVETVRYYQRRGLMAEPVRPLGGVRRYGPEDLDRLRFIRRAQAMGFTLAETEQLLELRAPRSCRATRDLAASKIRLIDARLRELRSLRRQLAGLVVQCDAGAEDIACPVIERLRA
jgi:MerR family mercuric resistance operon transcriptional regulator